MHCISCLLTCLLSSLLLFNRTYSRTSRVIVPAAFGKFVELCQAINTPHTYYLWYARQHGKPYNVFCWIYIEYVMYLYIAYMILATGVCSIEITVNRSVCLQCWKWWWQSKLFSVFIRTGVSKYVGVISLIYLKLQVLTITYCWYLI